MYWTYNEKDRPSGSVFQADMNGDRVYQLFGDRLYQLPGSIRNSNPKRLQLDPQNLAKLYFTDDGESSQRIWTLDVNRQNSARLLIRLDSCEGPERNPTKPFGLTCQDSQEPISSLSIIGDRFYFVPGNVLRSCEKQNGMDCEMMEFAPAHRVIYSHPEYNDIQINVNSSQPMTRQNDCEGGQGCSNVCALTPAAYSCICPNRNPTLANEPKTCAGKRMRNSLSSTAAPCAAAFYKLELPQPIHSGLSLGPLTTAGKHKVKAYLKLFMYLQARQSS